MFLARANLMTPSGPSSSSETPMISSLSPYSCLSCSSSGISYRHGGHQVAQKFTITTLPGQSLFVTGLPKISFASSGGAGSGSFTKRITCWLLELKGCEGKPGTPCACGLAARGKQSKPSDAAAERMRIGAIGRSIPDYYEVA